MNIIHQLYETLNLQQQRAKRKHLYHTVRELQGDDFENVPGIF